MAVVIDASLLVVIGSGDNRKATVQRHLEDWLTREEELNAPDLCLYEVANALTRIAASGALPRERLTPVWQSVVSIPIIFHPVLSSGPEIIALALTLGRRSAYDAAYIVLARRLGAELWTLDGPLYRNALAHGYPVHLVQ